MVAYSFKGQFCVPIDDGTKIGTIRDDRRGHGHARPGQELQLYTAMRTKHCRLVKRVTCLHVLPIDLDFPGRRISAEMGGADHAVPDLDAFAVGDGFRSFDEMKTFWADAALAPVRKHWILWVPLAEAVERGVLPDGVLA